MPVSNKTVRVKRGTCEKSATWAYWIPTSSHQFRQSRSGILRGRLETQGFKVIRVVMSRVRVGFGERWLGEYRWLSECRPADGSCRGSESH